MATQTISDFINLQIPPHIRAVFLDLDNTLYIYEPCHQYAIGVVKGEIEAIVGKLPDFDSQYKIAQEQVKVRIPNHAASHSRCLYFQTMFENLGRNDAHSHCARLERYYWKAFMSQMKPVPGLLDFLADCKENGTTVLVISDFTSSIQCDKLNELVISEYVHFLVTSEEAGLEKPASIIFKLGLEKVGCTAAETIMIGDSLTRDIDGASKIGINSILIKHEAELNQTPLRSERNI